VRPVFWSKTKTKWSRIQLVDVDRYPDENGPRRSICGNGVKRGPLIEVDGELLEEAEICSGCLQVLKKESGAFYTLEDDRPLLDDFGKLHVTQMLEHSPLGPRLRTSALAC
jgi:hypothetical protein